VLIQVRLALTTTLEIIINQDNICNGGEMMKSVEKTLKYIEFHIVDRCNLNCNGCSHFAPMVKKDFDHFDMFNKDIHRLKELVEHIEIIRLLGGEPFLDEDITRYIRLARELYPDANIEIATNGLLVPKLPEHILKSIHENSITIDVTVYPPTLLIVDDIHNVLEKHQITYRVQPLVKTFRKRFCPEGNNDIQKTFESCNIGRLYPFLYDGKLCLCSGAIVVKYVNEYYGMNIELKDCYYDIHAPEASADGIFSFLSRGNDTCAYCGEISEEPWSQCQDRSKIDLNHWLSPKSSYAK